MNVVTSEVRLKDIIKEQFNITLEQVNAGAVSGCTDYCVSNFI